MTCATCFGKFAKTIIGLVNMVMFIGAIIVGIVIFTKYYKGIDAINALLKSGSSFTWFIIGAAFVLISTFVGFTLLCCNSKFFQYVYLIVVIIVLLIEGAAYFVTKGNNIDENLDIVGKNWVAAFNNVTGDWNDKTIREAAHFIENFTFNSTDKPCCYYMEPVPLTYICNYTGLAFNNLTDQTCKAKIKEVIVDNFDTLKNATFILLGAQGLLLFFALIVAFCYFPEDEVNNITLGY